MSTKALTKPGFPALFDDFFRPWNEWFSNGGNETMTVPSVNITESDTAFAVAVAAPGLKKEDFKIDVEGTMLRISAEKKSETEEKQEHYTRKEYNYTSFSRSFTLPETVNKEGIEARYDAGILQLTLPKKEDAKNAAAKKISVN
jgi:HSP20 family protein